MDPTTTQEILDDLIPSLEALEAKSTAVLEFLKQEGIASDEKLAPYLEQAANASNVRWLGVRVRIERLLSAAEKHSAEKRSDKDETKGEDTQTKAAEAIQSGPAPADNSKSAGPENPSQVTEKDKSPETMRNHTEAKSNDSANDSTRNDKNDERVDTSEDKSKPAGTAADKKVA